eukprot:UC1_evm3s738
MALLSENESAILEALKSDLGSSLTFSRSVEINTTMDELQNLVDNFRSWARPESRTVPMLMAPSSAQVQFQPYGVALLISPWNYPIGLVLRPLATALAAGNCCVVKPSEVSVACSALLAELLPRYLDSRCVRVVQGAVDVATALLDERWDFICYTGSTTVGKIVHQAAAKHLTPCLLELGGKSPVIVTQKADLTKAAKRLAWAKFFLNMGQTCVCPDYVLVDASVEKAFLATLRAQMQAFYSGAREAVDVSRIVSTRHASRLAGMLEDDSIEVLYGGTADPDARYIEPTIVRATPESACMAEEIFGPILPVLTVQDTQEAVAFIRAREKPLALYIFSESQGEIDNILSHTSSGGVSVNDIGYHVNTWLPFGGVGASGMGKYHGIDGFRTFSHNRAVFQHYGPDPSIRFPPYTPFRSGALNFLQRYDRSLRSFSKALLVVIFALITFRLIK